jgi:hypothetical protein
LRETGDGGRSWFTRPLPAALLAAADRKVGGNLSMLYGYAGLNVRFADPSDGWIYGGLAVPAKMSGFAYVDVKATLWSTHDGGLRWRRQTLRGLGTFDSIFDLEAAHDTAYLLESDQAAAAIVKSSPVGSDSWHVDSSVALPYPAGGTNPSAALVLAGSSGWLVEGNDRGTTGSAQLASDGEWVSWTPPCSDVGHSFAIPAASTPENLVAVCVMGGFAYPLSKAAPPGATIGSTWLYLSSNGGKTFSAGGELGGRSFGFTGVLASPSPGVIVMGAAYDQSGHQELIASFDGGVHWTVLDRGQVLFVGFTSPSQGVAIIRTSSGSDTMIMSYDGGHDWAPVDF